MRLIDADELPHYDGTALSAVEVARAVIYAPTIEERKKGKWLRDPPEGGYALYKCSVCGKCWSHWWASSMTVEKMAKEVRCCPNCGADMRGNENEKVK